MKSEALKFFSDEILQEALKRFDFSKDNLHELNSFENFVFECMRKNNSYILRIVHSGHRTINHVLAEIDWINYLDKNGLPVCKPVKSVNDLFVEKIVISSDNYFSVVVFDKILGKRIENLIPEKSDDFVYNWGKIVGKMHRLTANYTPTKKNHSRPLWFEEIDRIKSEIKDDIVTSQKLEEIITKISSYEKRKDNFGLIHNDIHSGNLFIRNDSIVLFDFDDSNYNWFVSDIAVILMYSIWGKINGELEPIIFINWFLERFKKGYNTEYHLQWKIEELIDFIRLRHILVYCILKKEYSISKSDWVINIIKNWTPYIENDIPFIHLESLQE